jgi:hypothetical protein
MVVLTFLGREWKDRGLLYSLTEMVKTDQPSGNWGATQRAALAAKFKTGKVNHTNRSTNYLWQVCNLAEFKPYISNNPSRKNAGMQKEFLRYEQNNKVYR